MFACINLNDSSLHRLLKDIKKHAALGSKISRITINRSSTGKAAPETFRATINLCPNLFELQFEITDVFHYLKSLNCKEALLPNVQQIQIRNLLDCSPAVRRFHLWVNYRFRATITSIEIMDMKDNAALQNYGGLVAFASCFPQLTHLKAQCNTLAENNLDINLTELLKNNKRLQELKLYGVGKITNTLNELSSDPTLAEYPSLTKFKLGVSNIDLKSLEYIATRFTQLESLRLLASNVVPDKSLKETEATDILTKFKAFAVKHKRIHVSYQYKDEHFHEDNGKKKPTWISPNLAFLENLSRHYFMNDFTDEDFMELMNDENEDIDIDVGFDGDYFDEYDEEFAEEMMYREIYENIEDDDPDFASFFMDRYAF
ncbi:hypothetical protein [Parasitella parasitica]|uniref:Uncharacterized protein n=1 Tax=Parasitella parasitica TaxID=35722 RepID=A0A0B7NJ93_9FUNG|nr:hypothetical protein [Parasitella parasitica]